MTLYLLFLNHGRISAMATKLLIGLGNPGPEYEGTRHNVGWAFLDFLLKKEGGSDLEEEKRLKALVGKIKIDSSTFIIAKSLSFVNKSGEVVSKLARHFKVKAKDIIICHDDLDIEFGNFKHSFSKNSGGHKGVESVIQSLKTNGFHRFRFGISSAALRKARQAGEKKRDQFVRDYVLSKFTPSQRDELKKLFKLVLEELIRI